jgi:hypothetical protein
MRGEGHALRHEIEAPDIHNFGHGDRNSWRAFLRTWSQHHGGATGTVFPKYEINDTEPGLFGAFANIPNDDNPRRTKYSPDHTHCHTHCVTHCHRTEEACARTSQSCNKGSSAQTGYAGTDSGSHPNANVHSRSNDFNEKDRRFDLPNSVRSSASTDNCSRHQNYLGKGSTIPPWRTLLGDQSTGGALLDSRNAGGAVGKYSRGWWRNLYQRWLGAISAIGTVTNLGLARI